jgi:hypothetical protein
LLQKDAGFNSKMKNAAFSAAFCIATMVSLQPLLTGNGISAGFSVLVPLAYKVESRAVARLAKNTREETCVN